MVYNDAWRPFHLALLSASGLASLAFAIVWPSDAQADIDGKTLANSGQLPLPSGQFIRLQAATGAVLLPLTPRPARCGTSTHN